MSRSETAGRRRKAPATTKKTKTPAITADVADERHVCSEPGCDRSYKTERNLERHRTDKHPPKVEPQSAVEAVEAWLSTLTLTPSTGVLAAAIRELAAALTKCDPPDKAKTSKELGAKRSELLAELGGDGPTAGDWTESDGDDA